jgi:hypothetical protein
MRPIPDHTATAEEAAALIVSLARSRGLAPAAEIEDQAAILLGAFAQTHPDHPVARYFDRADDGQIEEFFEAVARQAGAGERGRVRAALVFALTGAAAAPARDGSRAGGGARGRRRRAG